MRIVSWNCNGGFRKKREKIEALAADILIIQECENPSQTSMAEFKEWASGCLWIGESKNKGIGVFNSNVIWDRKDRWWNHSDVVREFSEINIFSLYHTQFNQHAGKETHPTFYMYKNKQKPYHIDYAFCSADVLAKSTIEIGCFDEWIDQSDHMALIVDIK